LRPPDPMTAPIEVLVLFYSHNGSTERLARAVARGIDQVPDVAARLRTVPRVTTSVDGPLSVLPSSGPPYAETKDLEECAGLALGSPVRFGNMAAALKYFLDSTSPQWLTGALVGKPAAVFNSSATLHGGQESTLLSMMLPLMHHGMVIVGLPFTEPGLHMTTAGGTPYGATHVAGNPSNPEPTEIEAQLAMLLGKRLATIARQLAKP
jgi:NAD(P)H dehydrogenase (quinone)